MAAPSLQDRLGHLEDALLDMVHRGEALVLRVAAVLADGAPKFVVIWTKMNIYILSTQKPWPNFDNQLSQTKHVMKSRFEV